MSGLLPSKPSTASVKLAPAQDGPVLAAVNIRRSFSGVEVLHGVNLKVQRGEVLALMGENGAGKSTLMRILAGVDAGYDGTVLLDGAAVRFTSVRQAESAGLAIIHQELNLVPEMTVAENIFLGREPLTAGLFVRGRKLREEAVALVRRLGLSIEPSTKVRSLRVGEQQIVEIAKALSQQARVLIMDEPTSALSPAECERLFGIVRVLAAAGVAVVYISHRMDEVMALADRVSVLRDGRGVLDAAIADLDKSAIIRAMVGRDLSGTESQQPVQHAAAPVLSVRHLALDVPHRSGGYRRALDGVSFDIAAGEVLGIGGLLGSGRTEILETIFGSARGRRSGSVAIEGQPVAIDGPERAKALGLAFVTEDRKGGGLLLASSIADNVSLPSLPRLSRFGIRRPGDETGLARVAIARLGVRCTGPAQATGRLSGGNQQKVVLGKWLATAPRILLLDEPTRGIDIGAKQEIYALVQQLAADGLAIVFVSSEMPELLLVSHRILVMCEGRQTGILDRAAATQERVMELASPRARGAEAAA